MFLAQKSILKRLYFLYKKGGIEILNQLTNIAGMTKKSRPTAKKWDTGYFRYLFY